MLEGEVSLEHYISCHLVDLDPSCSDYTHIYVLNTPHMRCDICSALIRSNFVRESLRIVDFDKMGKLIGLTPGLKAVIDYQHIHMPVEVQASMAAVYATGSPELDSVLHISGIV